jgi:hypothetical protein
MQLLLPGEDIKFSDPADVGGSYEAFQYRTLLACCSAMGVPYTNVTGDLRQANYSSLREGKLEFRRRIEQLQHVQLETLTLRSIKARPVLLKLQRPVVARIATITDWPLILIDLNTEEGIVGRSYLEPYIPRPMRYLVPALHGLSDLLKGRALAPIEIYEASRKSLHFVGYQGLSMIAVAGLDIGGMGRPGEGRRSAALLSCSVEPLGPCPRTTAMACG